MYLTEHRGHFIPQSHVQGEVVAHVPVILDISAQQSLPQIPRVNSVRESSFQGVGPIGKEVRQRSETHYSLGVIKLKEVVTHILPGKAEFQSVSAAGQKGVIVELVGIPIVVRKPAGESRGHICKA